MADIVTQRNRLDQVLVQIQETSDGPCDLRHQLHVEHAVRYVVIFDQIKDLRLVDVAAVAIGMDNLVRIVKEIRANIFGSLVKTNRLRGLASISGKRTFLIVQAGFNPILYSRIPFHRATPFRENIIN